MLRAVANPAAGGQPGSFTTLTVSGAATIGGGLAVTGNLALEAGGVISSLSSDGSTQTAVSQTNAGTTDLVSYKGVGGGSFRFISGDAGGNTVVGSWTTGLLAVTGSISATAGATISYVGAGAGLIVGRAGTSNNYMDADTNYIRRGDGTNIAVFSSAGAVVTGLTTTDTLRVNVTPAAEVVVATHTAVFNINGTDYKFLCLAA